MVDTPGYQKNPLEIQDNMLRLRWFIRNQPLVTPKHQTESGEKPETIVIFGANGQIGKKLRKFLEEHHLYEGQVKYADVFFNDPRDKPGRKTAIEKADEAKCDNINIADMGQVERYLVKNNAKAVINLAAFLSADAEKPENKIAALKVNMLAPLQLMTVASELGIPKVQCMSSMAYQEIVPDDDHPPHIKDAMSHLHQGVSRDLVAVPDAPYGLTKMMAGLGGTMFSNSYGVDVSVPCLAGVLNAHIPWPADGTTEELDKMIVAAAAQEVFGDQLPTGAHEIRNRDKKLQFVNGAYIPEVTENTKFAMVDAETLPQAILMLMHKDLRKKDDHTPGAVHHVYEYTVSMGEAYEILKRKNPNFKVEWAKEYKKDPNNPAEIGLDKGKMYRAGIWPTSMDVTSTEKEIGPFRQYTAEESIKKAYDRAVQEMRELRFASGRIAIAPRAGGAGLSAG